ncbi:hypothetical protein EHN07_03815 [Buttiauxella warmboldiae]|uniref:Uncharacterized protein n=1 Tax=Buttiauxella warmboldiae TaxID=82993 RepID=A0A3N5E559_9ENTR|nr:hypothetical protein [Buttiauxella warmboldiae]RPH30239.1 hypothetical protein EHN07_03815 [Buttiauxella warmboldiae]
MKIDERSLLEKLVGLIHPLPPITDLTVASGRYVPGADVVEHINSQLSQQKLPESKTSKFL